MKFLNNEIVSGDNWDNNNHHHKIVIDLSN